MPTRFPNGLEADLTGNVTGNVTGDITGNITGNLTGGNTSAGGVASADGTVSVPSVRDYTLLITKGSAAALVLAAPTATTDDFKRVTIIAKTAHAHTVTHGGTAGFNNNGTATDVGTFGGAIGDGFTALAYQGAWHTGARQGITLG